MNFAALQSGWADLFVGALVESGVTDLVVSPGSRSTPFVLAAARVDALRTHALIDERAAGFFALGIARRTGIPAALLCTSGTAAAHYLPAIIEAAQSHIPLIAITADRPPELQQCRAPQTIDQTRLYGDFARGFIDLGVADAHPAALRSVRRKAAQAVALSLGPVPGPVQVNAPARKPLEHTGAVDEITEAALGRARAVPVAAGFAGVTAPSPEAVAALASAARRSQRGLIACGPAPAQQRDAREAVAALARATGFPVLAESTSQLRLGVDMPGACFAFDSGLRSPDARRANRPDLILELGAAPVSTAWRQYVADHIGCPRFAIGPYGWSDEHNAATAVVSADVTLACTALVAALDGHRPPVESEAWRATFADMDERARRALAPLSAESPLTQSAAARTVVQGLPNGGWLALGNSLSVRDVDAFCLEKAADVRVLSQRGASGIDGLIAGAAGSGVANSEPGVLVLGDVSFAHDIGGLAAARLVGSPLVVVVVDNSGGRIFEQLPIASIPSIEPTLERFWLTPPTIDVQLATNTFGLTCRRATTAAELASALREGLAEQRCSIVHAIVDPASATRDYARLHRLAAGADKRHR